MNCSGSLADLAILQTALSNCMLESTLPPPRANGVTWSIWKLSPNGCLQHGHMPFWSLNSFDTNPLESRPSVLFLRASRFCWIIRRASGFAFAHALLMALAFSRFAFRHTALLALTFSGLAFCHAAPATFPFSGLRARYAATMAFAFSGLAFRHAALLAFTLSGFAARHASSAALALLGLAARHAAP